MFFSLSKRRQASEQIRHGESEPRDLKLVGLINEARTEQEQTGIASGQ
jgi:hypothetical protein